MAKKNIIYVDVREEKSGIPRLLEEAGLLVVRKQLPMGDYLISDTVVIERKTAYDFARSLFDGRLFEQARRLAESYPLVFYIVEGNPFRLRRYSTRTKQITAAMVALAVDYNVRILYSEGPLHTAAILESLSKRIEGEGRRGVVIHKKPRLEDTRAWQLYILQSFPGIGPKTAERILERFGSLEAFFNASVSELSKVPGIGEKKAETIRRIIMYGGLRARRLQRRSLEDFVG